MYTFVIPLIYIFHTTSSRFCVNMQSLFCKKKESHYSYKSLNIMSHYKNITIDV